MVTIGWLDWRADRIEHIAEHRISPYEVEEAIRDRDRRIIKEGPAKRNPEETVYLVYGQTEAGRYLLVPLLKYESGDGALPLTARDMTEAEKRRHKKR